MSNPVSMFPNPVGIANQVRDASRGSSHVTRALPDLALQAVLLHAETIDLDSSVKRSSPLSVRRLPTQHPGSEDGTEGARQTNTEAVPNGDEGR
jgi:hypothetical protein